MSKRFLVVSGIFLILGLGVLPDVRKPLRHLVLQKVLQPLPNLSDVRFVMTELLLPTANLIRQSMILILMKAILN